jgi:hypothetical protein
VAIVIPKKHNVNFGGKMQKQSISNNSDTGGGHTSGFSINGRVEESRSFTLEELLTMDTVEVKDLLLACGSGEPKGRINQCRGVLLTDIINRTNVVITDHNDTKKMFIIASSSDGYRTVFSWQEMFNTSVGEGVMVVLEKDDKSVYEDHGSVDLFSARDFLTGPRYVKRLANIEIKMLE